jgi:predicted TIM-barrel fold metal-dependent hydrolase
MVSISFRFYASLQTIRSKHSKDFILFGSDDPLRAPHEDPLILDEIPWLTEDGKERILGKYAARLLGLI